MIIAIASGKGGTGKTTLSVAMSLAVNDNIRLLDCDVEEPNVHIFLNAENAETENVYVPIPDIDVEKCIVCGKCANICEYNALAHLQDEIMIFKDLCHSCGGCALTCPVNAITEINSSIGTISKAKYNNISLIQGKLQISLPMSPPLIRAVKSNISDDILNIIDCPPGTSCPFITAVSGADYVILVTEDTPFGLHDLKLSVETIKDMKIPFSVVINRINESYNELDQYCENEKIDVLLRIPESMKVSQAYSNGGNLLDAMPELGIKLRGIIKDIKESCL